ncbi:uncharacterized protein LOC117640687 [Thrips palmi]|uniref:Uncharacterized protein LOC117640687 n=1 Tax=Thrips palmi TaxID=161013 RepID=A0A6P8YAY1_THRPL|nr:uncharacterized protein LOC117640687 [Thrips palmi]XP_034233381.1 uncharacterized protein LOC117640687 [Thrips palmi]
MASKHCVFLVLVVALCVAVEAARRPIGLPKPSTKVTKPTSAQAHQFVTQCMALAKKGFSSGSKPHSDLTDCHADLYEDDLPNYLANMKRCVEPAAFFKLQRCINGRIASLG